MQAAKRAIHEGVVNAETPAALLLDGQKLASQATAVQSAFAGAHFNHAFAVKSNPTLVRCVRCSLCTQQWRHTCGVCAASAACGRASRRFTSLALPGAWCRRSVCCNCWGTVGWEWRLRLTESWPKLYARAYRLMCVRLHVPLWAWPGQRTHVHCHHRGQHRQRIVYDCPVKTEKDMVFALESGVDMNVDNFQELYRLDELLQRRGYDGSAATGVALPTLGVRLNPQVRSYPQVQRVAHSKASPGGNGCCVWRRGPRDRWAPVRLRPMRRPP